jgi:Kae1-associated kinase Bud32
LKQGAEAIIYLDDYLGRTVVAKERIPKGYRDPVLDDILRRERTVHEARMISLARRAGVRTPILYDVDVSRFRILMQYIEGRNLREMFEESVPPGVPRAIGRIAGSLHDAGLIHGDLTTSNMIDSSGLVLIDFGLGRRTEEIEDMGADLLLMEEALIGLHPQRSDVLDEIRDGYAARFSRAKEVFQKVDEIKKRRRYV